MRKHLSMAVAVLAICCVVSAGQAKDKDATKAPLVVKLEVKKGLSINRRGRPNMPTVIKDAKALASAVPGKDAMAAIMDKVDFDKQIVVYFSWAGSGQDKLGFSVNKDTNEVTFEYTPGRTRDLRPHAHVFAVKKGTKYSVKTVRGGRGGPGRGGRGGR